MARQRIEMTRLRQILTQRMKGESLKGISRNCGTSLRTVKKYVRAAKATKREIGDLLSMEDHKLMQLLFPPPDESENTRLARLWNRFPYVEKELRRTGVTRSLLWHEYKGKDPDGYNYSQFCYYFQQWRGQQAAVMHLDHEAGDKLFIDYAGKKLKIMDWISGEEKEVEVFVAVLGASGYAYVEVSQSQQKEDFIASVENALHFFGGVPRAVVPDNLKSAVTKSSKYEAQLNETFEDFANHYGFAVLPARARKPRDKALVENAVNLVYQRIYALIRNRQFGTLEELNEAILPLLHAHNARPFQGQEQSRKDRFEELDAPTLSDLPAERYEIKYHKWVKVQKNSHVHFHQDRHHYSVPHRYIGKKVKLTWTRRTVEIYLNRERIAFHRRNTRRFAYTSVPEHLPSNHQFRADWSPGFFLNKAQKIGWPVVEFFKALFERKQHPEQAYKSCMGILQLGKRFGYERLIQACQRAIDYHCFNYRCVKDILEKGLDKLGESPQQSTESHIPDHDNIRGNYQ